MSLTPEQQASDENTPPDRLRILAKQSIEIARIVARNSSADSELLKELAFYEDEATREGVVTNANTPPEILWQLRAQFPQQLLSNPVLSLFLLENPNLPLEIPSNTLFALLNCKELPDFFWIKATEHRLNYVRNAIAKNLNTPIQALKKLSESNDFTIRIAIAENPQTPLNLLKQLTQDKNDFVCFAAAKQLVQKLKQALPIDENGSVDTMTIFAATNLEVKRLGWTSQQGRDYLLNTYGKRSRHLLNDNELIEFWMYLREL